MVTEQMQADFDAWYPPPGIPITRESAWEAWQTAFARGQEHVMETAKPVGWATLNHDDAGFVWLHQHEVQADCQVLHASPGIRKHRIFILPETE
jgi:hypothetical protein